MTSPAIFDRPAEMRAWTHRARGSERTVALVPTMGALHDGHIALIDLARERADVTVVSIFVNPLQFGEASDFSRYPRPLDDDLALCREAGVAAIYAPTAATMYPSGFDTRVVPGALAEVMEGASRPGHFEGVTTVVTKLFTTVRPDIACFGEKDFQQLAIVRRLASDLDLGVEVVACPTVREADGLALSSRNQRLSGAERAAASCVPRAIDAALRAGATALSPAEIAAAATSVIAAEPLASLDYVAVFDPDTLLPVDSIDQRRPGTYRLALAVRFGDVRLIDNADVFAARFL